MFRRLRRKLGFTKVKTLSSVNAYDKWAQNYPPYAHNPLMNTEEEAMLALLPELRGKIVLDLACGSGRYSGIAQAQGATIIIACDNALSMLNMGRGDPMFKTRNSVCFTGATTVQIPIKSRSIDVVLCGLAIGHVEQLQATLKEIARILVKGGVALISDFHPFLALTGRQRLFTAPDGTEYAVEHYVHLIAIVFKHAQQVGLKISALSEPLLSVDGQQIPVVVVYRLEKL